MLATKGSDLGIEAPECLWLGSGGWSSRRIPDRENLDLDDKQPNGRRLQKALESHESSYIEERIG